MEINKRYWICVDVGGNKILTYEALILKIQNNFVSFIEKKGRLLNYNMDKVLSYEEILEKSISTQ